VDLNTVEEKIFRFLDSNAAKYEVFEHPAVYTCEVMARLLKTNENSIAKSMIVKNSDEAYLLAVLPGGMRVDFHRLARIIEVKSVSLAPIKEAELIAGCSVGCVHPFGNLINIPTHFDKNLFRSEHVFFNPGSHTKSVKMSTKDLEKLTKPKMSEFAVSCISIC